MARSKSRNIADLVGDRGTLTLNSNNLSSTFSDIDLTGTGSLTLPSGTTSQRDGTPANGMIRYNSDLNVFEGYKSGAWSEIGGGSSDTWTTDNFTGNGSTAAYTLTQAPSSEDNVIAFIEGVFQNPADFVVSGTTITFDDNIPSGQKVVVHTVKATVAGNNLNLDAFTGNGSNTQFTLSINPIDERNSMVYLDGVYQNKDTYSLANQVLHFSTAPATSAAIEVLTFTQTTINAPTSNSVSTTSLIDDSVTSAKLGHALTLQGNTIFNGSIQTQNISIPDNYALRLGSSQDVQFYHDGNHARLRNATGNFNMQADDFHLTDAGNTTLRFRVDADGATDIRYNGVTKLLTTATGVTANGIVTATTFSGDLNGTINTATTATTQANSVASTTVATTAFVSNKITELIGGAPSTLNDLNELAAAINDDSNYNSTLTTALATKLPLAGGTLTGALTGIGLTTNGARNIIQRANDDSSIAFADNASGTPSSHAWAIGYDYSAGNGLAIAYANNGIPSLTGSQKILVLPSGFVGIGTSPGVELDIKRTTNATPLRVGSEGGQGRAIVFADVASTPTKYNWIAGSQYSLDNAFEITPSTAVGGYTFSNPAIAIKNNGHVGIGGISALNSKFNVFGDGEVFRVDGTGNTSRSIRFRNVGTNGTSNGIIVSDGTLQLKNEDANAAIYLNSIRDMEFQVTSGNGTAGKMRFYSYNTQIMHLDGGSNYVGIGKDAPTAKLHISGNSDGGDEDCMLIIEDVDGSAGSRIPAIMFRGETGGTVTNHGRIRGTDTQGMILSGSSGMGDDLVVQAGAVGIGTSSIGIGAGLHIQTNDGTTNSAVNSLMITNLSTGTTTTGFGGEIRFQAERNSGVNQNTGGIRSVAEVNLNTNISSGMAFDTSAAGVNSEKLRITYEGDVGIGTITPHAKLSIKQALTASNADLRLLDIVIPGSWSNSGNAGHTADITWTNSENAGTEMGKFGLRYAGTAMGGNSEFVFKDMYQGGYGASADIMYLGSNGYVGIPGKLGVASTSFAADGSSTLQVGGRLGIMENTGTQLQVSTGPTYAWMEAWDNTSDRAPKRPICFNPWGGGVGIGTSAPGDYHAQADDLVIVNSSGHSGITIASSTTDAGNIFFADGTSGSQAYMGSIQYFHGSDASNNLSERMSFGCNGGSEVLRLSRTTNIGYTSDGLFNSLARPSRWQATGSGALLLGYRDSGSGLYSAALGLEYDTVNGLSQIQYVDGFLMRESNTGTLHFRVETNGNVKNTNNSYGSTSDSRLKTDIVDAASQWDDVKALRVRKYKFGTAPAGHDFLQIGVIAQELEASGMSGLVSESEPDDGQIAYAPELVGGQVKTVKYSVLYMKAIKALQEAMTRIETLESKVATLEGE